MIVPGFGGFVTGYQPAEIQRFKNVLYPPSKTLMFNRRLQSNDGVLIHQIVQNENIDYKTAEEKVRKLAGAWSRTLDNKGMLVFPEIGKIYVNSKNVLVFMPDLRKNYLKDSFGLKPVAFQPLNENAVKENERSIHFSGEQDYRTAKTARRKRIAKISTVAAVAILLLFFLPQMLMQDALPEKVRIEQLNLFDVFKPAPAEPAFVPERTAIRNQRTGAVRNEMNPALRGAPEVEVFEELKVLEEPKTQPTAAPAAKETVESSGMYYIIFGKHDYISDAIRHKKNLDEQYQKVFEVFSTNGIYHVGLLSGRSKQEAEAGLQTYHSSDSNVSIFLRL